MAKPKRVKRLCFDVETFQFSEAFRTALDDASRQHLAPKMRLACVFDGVRYRYFLPEDAHELIQLLSQADELISFNGPRFDELVLRRHYGLNGRFPLSGRHIDIWQAARSKTGRRVSLNTLAKLNLGERKHTSGRSMDSLDIEELKQACRSDVSQTWRLWKLLEKGELKLPPPRFSIQREYAGGPGDYMPDFCPSCHSADTLEFVPVDRGELDDMTEGQMAEYMAGTWGYAACEACHEIVHWEMVPPSSGARRGAEEAL